MKARIKLPISFFEKLTAAERRWGTRRPSPSLAVYYWNGGTPKPHGVRDISGSGVYLLTQDALFPGAVLLLTMQREDLDESCPDRWIAVHALVIRRDPEGVALSYVFPRTRDSRLWASDVANGATRDEMASFISKLFEHDDRQSQTAVRLSDVHPAHPDAESISDRGQCSQARRTIRASEVCVCNLTRERLVSLDMRVIDTVHEPLKNLIYDLSHVTNSGFWLTPFRGLPSEHGLSQYDVMFLDDNYRIAECAKESRVSGSGSFRGKHASAIIVPSRSISSSQFQVGDQLKVCSPDTRATHTDPLCGIACKKAGASNRKQSGYVREAARLFAPIKGGRAGTALRPMDENYGTSSIEWDNPATKTQFLRWLFPNIKPSDRRRATRIRVPDLIAFYSTGGRPNANKVSDVSSTGLYLLTDERWILGTRIVMTIQRESCTGKDPTDWSRVESKVVRCGTDGVGFEFIEMKNAEILQQNGFDKRAFDQFLGRITAPRLSPL